MRADRYQAGCWLARFGVMERGDPMPPCDGRLIRAHLIPRSRIKWTGANVLDQRSWVWACGGPTGVGGHHGLFDSYRLRVPRAHLPPLLVEFAAENDLSWYLDRRYATL